MTYAFDPEIVDVIPLLPSLNGADRRDFVPQVARELPLHRSPGCLGYRWKIATSCSTGPPLALLRGLVA
jgi:hypothetical protein